MFFFILLLFNNVFWNYMYRKINSFYYMHWLAEQKTQVVFNKAYVLHISK